MTSSTIYHKVFAFIVLSNVMKPICLTIAGTDPTSGAGIQMDIRTFDRCGVHPFSVITAITYQSAKKFYSSYLSAFFSNALVHKKQLRKKNRKKLKLHPFLINYLP